MKILMVTTGVSLMDGVNRHITSVAPELNKRMGVEVAVLTEQPWGELCDVLKKCGVKVYALGCPHGHALRLLPRVCRVMLEFKPDIVHVHVLPLMARIALSVFWRNKCRFVLTVHGIGDPVLRVTWRMRLERLLNRLFPIHFDSVAYISNGVRRHCGGKGEVVYNPIEFDGVKPPCQIREELGLDARTPLIGTACRFAAVKQPELFVEVMCRVLEDKKDAHALLIGDGDAQIKEKMREIQSRYHVDDRMHWLGCRPDASAVVGALDCFVMTSLREGLPTALLEAMSAKVPIAFLKGEGGLEDLAEMNEREGPIAVVADDKDALVSGIEGILGNSPVSSTMAERAFEVGKRHFDVQAVALKLEKFYCEVMSK